MDACPAGLTLIEVPGAPHGFDTGPANDAGQAAVLAALEAVAERLGTVAALPA